MAVVRGFIVLSLCSDGCSKHYRDSFLPTSKHVVILPFSMFLFSIPFIDEAACYFYSLFFWETYMYVWKLYTTLLEEIPWSLVLRRQHFSLLNGLSIYWGNCKFNSQSYNMYAVQKVMYCNSHYDCLCTYSRYLPNTNLCIYL